MADRLTEEKMKVCCVLRVLRVCIWGGNEDVSCVLCVVCVCMLYALYLDAVELLEWGFLMEDSAASITGNTCSVQSSGCI